MQRLNPPVCDNHNGVVVVVGKPHQVLANAGRNKWHIPRYRQRPSLYAAQTGRKSAQGPLFRFIVPNAIDPGLGARISQFRTEFAFPSIAQGGADFHIVGKNDRTVNERQQPLDHVKD